MTLKIKKVYNGHGMESSGRSNGVSDYLTLRIKKVQKIRKVESK